MSVLAVGRDMDVKVAEALGCDVVTDGGIIRCGCHDQAHAKAGVYPPVLKAYSTDPTYGVELMVARGLSVIFDEGLWCAGSISHRTSMSDTHQGSLRIFFKCVEHAGTWQEAVCRAVLTAVAPTLGRKGSPSLP